MTNSDYVMDSVTANELKGIALLPRELRLECLRRWLERNPAVDVAAVIADLIGICNSTIENASEMLRVEAVSNGLVHHHQADNINLPTLFGALCGVELAQGIDQDRVCAGCAYRLGTAANQSPCTTLDAKDCVDDRDTTFMCHMDLDQRGEPTHACPGYAQALRLAKRCDEVAAA